MNTTNLHLLDPINRCLDCKGKLVDVGESEYNRHYECENCGAHFYWSKSPISLDQYEFGGA